MAVLRRPNFFKTNALFYETASGMSTILKATFHVSISYPAEDTWPVVY